jgi:hypothetical protein
MNTTGRKTVKANASAPKSVKATATTGTTNGATKHAPTFEDIAKRSYELYLARGGETGHEVEDWLAAESELSGKLLS